MAGSGGGEDGTMSQLVATRSCWLPAEDHLGEIFSPRDVTHKMVGNRHYKRDCPKLKKDNNKRGREEAHITEEVEDAEKKKSKKEEVKDLYYN